MDDQQHPVTPPPELAAQWAAEIYGDPDISLHPITLRLVERAAQWGADQELEACCKWLLGSAPWTVGPGERIEWVETLAMCRRPKPRSLAEQALEALRSTPCTEQRHYDALLAALTRLKQLEDSND